MTLESANVDGKRVNDRTVIVVRCADRVGHVVATPYYCSAQGCCFNTTSADLQRSSPAYHLCSALVISGNNESIINFYRSFAGGHYSYHLVPPLKLALLISSPQMHSRRYINKHETKFENWSKINGRGY